MLWYRGGRERGRGEQQWLDYKTCHHHRGARREVIDYVCVFIEGQSYQVEKVIDCTSKVFSFTIRCCEPTPQVPANDLPSSYSMK